MKKQILGLSLFSMVMMAFAGGNNNVINQSTEQQPQQGNKHAGRVPLGNGYRVYMTLDSVFVAGNDNRLQYAWPISDTSYLAVLKTLRETGKLQPKR